MLILAILAILFVVVEGLLFDAMRGPPALPEPDLELN